MGIYLRYTACSLLLILSFLGIMTGGLFMWTGFVLTLLLATIGDYALPRLVSTDKPKHPSVLNTLLFASFPLLCLNLIAYLWFLAPGDPFQWGTIVENLVGVALLDAKQQTGWFDLIGGFLTLGLIIATAGTNVAHELVHRVWSPFSVFWGRLLLAFTADTTFSIEHVYGHHRNIATRNDPATARREENSYSFIFRSTFGAISNAWKFEKLRFKKIGSSHWTFSNRVISGFAMHLAFALVYGIILQSLLYGLLFYLFLAAYGKTYLELINYVEHYGLVRVPGQPVEPRHSWNSTHRISTVFLYNLTRHSHHHAQGHLPFWKLNPNMKAPELPYGYLTMIIIALFPNKFHRLMEPLLKKWDRGLATEEELDIIHYHQKIDPAYQDQKSS